MGRREMRDRGTRGKKTEGKKELKHTPKKVYVGKQKKKRQNHSWENDTFLGQGRVVPLVPL